MPVSMHACVVAMKPNRTRVRECALVNDQKIVFSFHLFVRTSPSLLFLLFLSFPCLNHFVFLTISHPNKPFVADASAALSSDTASRSISVSMTSSHVSKSPNCFAASPSRANKLDHCSTCIASAHTHTHTHTHTHPHTKTRATSHQTSISRSLLRNPSLIPFHCTHISDSFSLTLRATPEIQIQRSFSDKYTGRHTHTHSHTHTHTRARSLFFINSSRVHFSPSHTHLFVHFLRLSSDSFTRHFQLPLPLKTLPHCIRHST